MKPRKITLFLASIIAALAVICVLFPSDGIIIGSHSFYLPTIHDLAEANSSSLDKDETANGITAEMTELSDSITTLQTFSDSSDIRFWLPDSLYFTDFCMAIRRLRWTA